MRFCPFCSAENEDVATHCSACARRLPPRSPHRRATSQVDDSRTVVDPHPGRRIDDQPAVSGASDDWESLGSVPSTTAERTHVWQSDGMAGSSAPDHQTPEVSDDDLHEWPAPAKPTAAIQNDWAPGADRTIRDATPSPTSGRSSGVASNMASGDASGDASGQVSGRVSGQVSDDVSDRVTSPISVPSLGVEDEALAPSRALVASEAPSAPSSASPADSDSSAVPTLFSGRRATPRISMPTPPPTRVGSTTGPVKTPFEPPDVVPVPEVPEPGLINAAGYAVSFTRAHWQRRSVIKNLDSTIKKDTVRMDDELGTLGKHARSLGVDNRVLEAENQAIDEAENRHATLERECAQLSHRQAEEDRSFAKLEGERQSKVDDGQGALDKVQQELATLEAQRRGLRDKFKVVERQLKSLVKSIEEREEQAAKASMGDARAGLRQAVEDLRKDARALEPEKQDIEQRLVEFERPISQAMARIEARKAELDAARRSLDDAREGHRHRLAELEAEQSRKKHELAQAGAEIQRRLVTLGTLVNLHRIERPEFDDLYARIDELRGAIGARSSEIDRLAAEREAYDRGSLVRGFFVLAGGVAVIVIFFAVVIAIIV